MTDIRPIMLARSGKGQQDSKAGVFDPDGICPVQLASQFKDPVKVVVKG